MYQIVKTQNWTIRGPDNQPMQGHKITVADPQTGDSFDLEVPNLDTALVQERVRFHLEQRRATQNLTFD